jgi:hypothetical protein
MATLTDSTILQQIVVAIEDRNSGGITNNK